MTEKTTKIKICGLTNREDYEMVVRAGADYTGFIFYEKSPRCIPPETARDILREGADGTHQKVGVFVNEEPTKVKEIFETVGLDIVQLHGDESPEYCAALGLPFWKVLRVKGDETREWFRKTMSQYDAEAFLLDTFSSTQYGGTGTAFNPRTAQEAIAVGKPVIIAGGVSSENIEALSELSPFAVDINSTIEAGPGKKDAEKTRGAFLTPRRGGPIKPIRDGRPPGPPEKLLLRKDMYFGEHGGRYVPEMLIPALDQLETAYNKAREDETFHEELQHLFTTYSGRPTPLYFAANLTRQLNGAKIYLKLESLNHTGAHKINNVLGQMLLAQRMNKTHIIAETGAGQHGLATATAAARSGMKCKVFMGETDIKRQYPNVYAMRLLGAEVVPVTHGTRTLKDAVNAALKYWIEHLDNTHYLLGSALGPYPYPLMVRDFQSIIGKEVKAQIKTYETHPPDILVACVGGGSNSIGLFHPFLDSPDTYFYGVEAGGRGTGPGEHAVRFGGQPKTGIVQGYRSYFIQDENGQVQNTHSVSAGLDYAGIGPELAHLYDTRKVRFVSVSDDEALHAYRFLSKTEGIIPALESAHAVAYALKLAPQLSPDKIMVVNISGRGDKDIFIAARELDHDNWLEFLKNEVENGDES